MFGCQVMNQSVENGSMPLGGDTPLSSLYSLSSRSRDNDVSISSSCNLAPRLISSIASRMSRASDTSLLLDIRPSLTLRDRLANAFKQSPRPVDRPSGWLHATATVNDLFCNRAACREWRCHQSGSEPTSCWLRPVSIIANY